MILSWDNPNDASITGYKVLSTPTADRDSATRWTAIPSSGAGTVSHTVTSLVNGTPYSFKVRAVNSDGDGVPSDWVAATPDSNASVVISRSLPDH